ncbi:MAG: hypothetical protein ACRDSJ_11515 [Rubrobacteraceae bacterium]
MKSVVAILLGVLLSFVLAILVVFGIFAPVLTAIFGLDQLAPSTLPLTLMVFAAAFAFYFGGMAAAYRAPSHRALHGALVAATAFLISPIINVATGQGPFPRVDSTGAVIFLLLLLAVSAGAAYVGGRRGESLYFHNQRLVRPKNPRRET